MSDWCLITCEKNKIPEDHHYDCIYTENGNDKDLYEDWMMGGPLKLVVRDESLFNQFLKDFLCVASFHPLFESLQDIWEIFYIKEGIMEMVYEDKKYTREFMGMMKSFKNYLNSSGEIDD